MPSKTMLLLTAVLGLSACVSTDGERALVGAAGGAVISEATGGSVLTGALIGGAAGVVCDDVGVCN
ncbi:MAG: hypothetical protein B7Y02_00505 [Rhodobacterales bacterium 17-64-5]|nr:MAG: hypothetical protein B7Y02_00505 [Rhodobacterales bacterium 17-64-5]